MLLNYKCQAFVLKSMIITKMIIGKQVIKLEKPIKSRTDHNIKNIPDCRNCLEPCKWFDGFKTDGRYYGSSFVCVNGDCKNRSRFTTGY